MATRLHRDVSTSEYRASNGEWWAGENLERRGRVFFRIQLRNCLYEFRQTTINLCKDNRCEIVGFRHGVLRPSLFWDFMGRSWRPTFRNTMSVPPSRHKQMGHIPCPKRRRATLRIIKEERRLQDNWCSVQDSNGLLASRKVQGVTITAVRSVYLLPHTITPYLVPYFALENWTSVSK